MVFFLGDFFQLLFACCQENVFSMERFKRLTEQASSGSAFNSNRRGSRGKTVTPDFMWNITWLDFVKVDFVKHRRKSTIDVLLRHEQCITLYQSKEYHYFPSLW